MALVGIALSASLSAVLDLTNLATGVESLLAGLIGTAISLQVDALARAERRFELRGLVRGDPWLAAALTPIVEGTRQAVEAYPDTRIAAEARRRYERFRAETDQLRAGRIVRPDQDFQDLFGATGTATHRLEAVTNVMPRASGELSWWNSDAGRHHWRLNLDALARGVQITRIFIFTELTPELRALVDRQRQAGVRVGLLPSATVSRSLHVNAVLFDGTSAWEARMSAHGEISENVFTVNAGDLERLRDTFATCLSLADLVE